MIAREKLKGIFASVEVSLNAVLNQDISKQLHLN